MRRGTSSFGAYFDLKEDLEALFQRRVDLVEPHVIRNPYFKRSVDLTRRGIATARRDPRKYLYDIRKSCEHLERFRADRCFEDYLADQMLRDASERCLQIIGTALYQMARNNV